MIGRCRGTLYKSQTLKQIYSRDVALTWRRQPGYSTFGVQLLLQAHIRRVQPATLSSVIAAELACGCSCSRKPHRITLTQQVSLQLACLVLSLPLR